MLANKASTWQEMITYSIYFYKKYSKKQPQAAAFALYFKTANLYYL